MELKKFRPPEPQDILEDVSFCTPYFCGGFWGRLLPSEKGGDYAKFSKDLVERLLFYGTTLISDKVEKKDFKIDGTDVGELEYVRVATMHGQQFDIFNIKYLIGIVPVKN